MRSCGFVALILHKAMWSCSFWLLCSVTSAGLSSIELDFAHWLNLAERFNKQTVRVATRYAPAPLLPRGRPRASRAAEQTQRSSSFPRPIRSHGHCASRVKAAVSKAAWWPWHLTFDLLTLKVVSESRVTWATSVPILVFLGLSVLDLGPMYATDRCRTSDRRQTSDKSIA